MAATFLSYTAAPLDSRHQPGYRSQPPGVGVMLEITFGKGMPCAIWVLSRLPCLHLPDANSTSQVVPTASASRCFQVDPAHEHPSWAASLQMFFSRLSSRASFSSSGLSPGTAELLWAPGKP